MKRVHAFLLALFLLLTLIPVLPTATAEVSYDVSYEDNVGDVFLLTRQGAELGNIDITYLSSTLEQNLLTQEDQIILTMQVKGKISSANTTGYVIQMEADEEFYVFQYAAGVCVEIYSGQIFVATGSGTKTLEIIVPLGEIETPQTHYDISSFTAYNNPNGLTYMDLCPDDTLILTPGGDTEKPLEILEPTDGATVYGISNVKGRTYNTQTSSDIRYVEVQMDTWDDDEWVRATSYDGYISWSYEWDTTEYSEEPHTITVRAYNGSVYFVSTAEYWVDQATATSPRSTAMPEVRVGDRYWYDGYGSFDLMGVHATITIMHNVTLWGVDTVKVKGNNYEVFVYWSETHMEADVEIATVTSIAQGYTFLDRYTLAAVKVDQWVNSTIPLQPPSIIHTVVEYDPPLDSMAFPLTVGDMWNSESTLYTTTVNNGEETKDSTEVDAEYEVLRTQDVTVPAGTFDTFVKRSENTSGEAEEGSFSGLDTSGLTDGWSLSYFSPEIGYLAKEETFDSDGNIMNTLELIDYSRGTGAQVIIANISAGPEPKVGEKTWISVLVKNTGIQNAQGVRIYINDSEVNLYNEVVDVEAQNTRLINISWTPSSKGRHTIFATSPDHSKHRFFEVEPGDNGSTSPADYWWVILLVVLVAVLILVIIVVLVLRKRKGTEDALVVEEYEEKPKGRKKKSDDD